MGSRVQREAPADLQKRRAKAAKLSSADEVERNIRRQQERSNAQFGAAGILDAVAEMEGLRYRPRTAETREVYELMLGLVHSVLGDQTQEVVRSAADTVLESLKSDDLKEFDKRKEVEGVLGNLDEDRWSQLVNLSKKVSDYGEEEEAPQGDDRERAVDNEGVAVLFEDDEEEEEENYEVKGGNSDDEDADSDDEEEEDEDNSDSGEPEDADENLVLGREQKSSKSKSDKVSPLQVDAFWLQRTIGTYYPDPVQSSDFTTRALELLGSEAELRDLENSLAEMFGYENFDLVALLTKNREVIVWCTKLARSSDQEKQDVEVAMREKGVGYILRQLRGGAALDSSSGAAGSFSASAAQAPAVPTKANIQPGTIAAPRKVIDIDSLIFTEGSHLMSRKKVKLPEGSFKRQMKGYEEIHVPEPKRREAGADEWMSVRKMPDWTQPVWASVKAESLNPIQTRVFPIAFETNEPMLICAPTGAGKVCISVCHPGDLSFGQEISGKGARKWSANV